MTGKPGWVRRRSPGPTAAGVLAASALLLPVGSAPPVAVAAPEARASACTGTDQFTATVGIPGEAIGTVRAAGAAEVRFTCLVDHATESLRLPHPHAGDRFGTAIARGYLNDDGWEDVAVGIPGLDVDGHADAGGVAIFHGSKTGLHYVTTLTQASKGIPGTVGTGAEFGAVLATSGTSDARAAVLRIGEPGKTVDGHRDAGGFVDLPYLRGTLHDAREVTLASKGIPGSPATGDRLGSALDGTWSVGAPGRTVKGHAAAGEVLIAPIGAGDPALVSPSFVITQSTPGVDGTPESGDHFGAALSQNWVGVPGESIGSVRDAGMVERYAGVGGGRSPVPPAESIIPGRDGVPGTPTAGASFGAALGEFGFPVDGSAFMGEAVLVGAPGQPDGGRAAAGRVTAVGTDEPDPAEGGPFSFTGVYQTLTDPDPTTDGRFGACIVQPTEYTMEIGAPGNAGGRVSLYRNASPYVVDLPLVRQTTWHQVAGVPETGDEFGAALAGPTF